MQYVVEDHVDQVVNGTRIGRESHSVVSTVFYLEIFHRAGGSMSVWCGKHARGVWGHAP